MEEPQRVNVNRTQSELDTDLDRVRKLAKMLDAQFEIGGVKVGWDAIVGLIPVAGDVVTSLLGLYPLMIANKHKLGRTVQTRMAMNLLIDWGVGSIPILGDFIDVAYKANIKNLKLLERAVEQARARQDVY